MASIGWQLHQVNDCFNITSWLSSSY